MFGEPFYKLNYRISFKLRDLCNSFNYNELEKNYFGNEIWLFFNLI